MSKINLHYQIDPAMISPTVSLAHFAPAPKGLNIKWRLIDNYEVVYILENHGIYKVLEMENYFEKGDVIFTPPWLWHGYKTPPKLTCPHFAIHFSFFPGCENAYAGNQTTQTGIKNLKISIGNQCDVPLVTKNFPHSKKYLFEKVARLKAQSVLNSFPTIHLRLKEAMLSLLNELIEHITGANEHTHPHVLSKSLNHIEKHFTTPITIQDLADIESLTPNYYSTLFKRHYALSPIEYITKLRLSYAKQLMLTSEEKLTDIARTCGYDDPYYFSKVFKKSENIAPSEYRKSYVL